MSEVKWIKITTDIFDDEKILLIESLPEADSIIVIWFKLLCLAGKMNNSGVFIMNNRMPYTEKMLSTIFRRKESTVRLALETFETFGMIEIVNDAITIPNWGKHQSIDQLDNKREYMREYMREYRQKQKEIACKTNGKTNSKANVSSVEEEREIEIDKDLIIQRIVSQTDDNAPQKRKKSVKIPPDIEDVRAYCKERNNNIDPEAFIDFYTAKGWKIGKAPMKDWKAAVRTWERNRKDNTSTTKDRYSELDALIGGNEK